MKFSLDWLKNIFSGSSQKPSTRTTSSPSFDKIVVAKVVKVEKHPNADRLRVITLDIGGQIIEPIVCGAFNFDTGAVVALALPGAFIPQNIHTPDHAGFTLEKAKIRGVESQGMICAAYELGLSSETGSGVMILKDNATLGQNFSPDMIK